MHHGWDSPPNSNWSQWQTMAIARALRLSLIVVLWHTRCNKDIANSPGRIGEQVRGDIKDGLKFLHILMTIGL